MNSSSALTLPPTQSNDDHFFQDDLYSHLEVLKFPPERVARMLLDIFEGFFSVARLFFLKSYTPVLLLCSPSDLIRKHFPVQSFTPRQNHSNPRKAFYLSLLSPNLK